MKKRHLCLLFSPIVLALLWAAPAGATTLDTVPGQNQIVHVVQPGENLFRISLRYGTTVDAIMAANGLTDPNAVYAGQQLLIPQGSSAPAAPSAGAAPGGAYTVRPGDTLGQIAASHGVTLLALIQANGLANPNLIYTGQRLAIPGAGRSVSGAAAPNLSSDGGKRIVIDLSEQHLYAYQGERLVYSFVASSGAAPTYTGVGEFRVQSKIPKAFGATWNIWMPFWLGVYWAGSTENGIHALPILPNGQTLWTGFLGRPISYGCIVLGTQEAQLLYNWADLGTPVTIRQ